MILKHCKHCVTDKPLTEFNKCATIKGGLYYLCKPCKRAKDLISDTNRRAKKKITKVKECGTCNWYSAGRCVVKNPGETCTIEKDDKCHKWEGIRRLAMETGIENMTIGDSLLTKLVKKQYAEYTSGFYGECQIDVVS